MEQKETHYVTFYDEVSERNETLCDGCYREWLESIKG